jgi:heme-degrading monooxygenase HmoA
MTGYTYIWEFQVRPGKQTEFERIYGPDGRWVELFRQAAGYVGTLLLKDRAVENRYVTIDRWRHERDYKEFRARFAKEYQALDAECQDLTIREISLGEYGERLAGQAGARETP